MQVSSNFQCFLKGAWCTYLVTFLKDYDKQILGIVSAEGS
jgi:hypothetical protein